MYVDNTVTVLYIIYDPTITGDLTLMKLKHAVCFAELWPWAITNSLLLNDKAFYSSPEIVPQIVELGEMTVAPVDSVKFW